MTYGAKDANFTSEIKMLKMNVNVLRRGLITLVMSVGKHLRTKLIC